MKKKKCVQQTQVSAQEMTSLVTDEFIAKEWQ